MLLKLLTGFVLLAVIFIPLEHFFYLRRQPLLRHQWGTDLTYFFLGHFIGKAGMLVSAIIAVGLTSPLIQPGVQHLIAQQPAWLQFLEAVVIADLGYYLAHRLLHTIPWLWQFHAIHHSIEEMDWLATVRVHPVDQMLTKGFQIVPLYWLGFSQATFGSYLLFASAIAFLIHANVRLKFGPLQWLVATPEFHHWHHSNDPGVYNKNLAAQLPILDWLFGTLHLPSRRMPERYGVNQPVPRRYWQQLLYPFRGKQPYAS